jgi:two-component system chemotaxis response regulator CheB
VKPVRVLIVDDSAAVRSILSRRLSDSGLDVVGVAADPYIARDLILLKKPDVLTLDLEMPRMDGLTFLDRLMTHYPLPVVVLSSLTEARSEMALQALELGAVEVIAKPGSGLAAGLEGDSMNRLVESLRAAAQARPRRRPAMIAKASGYGKGRKAIEITSDKVVAIGASTGGTQALAELLAALPVDHPGILVVQHMPPYFTKTFAERLDKVCALRVREARTGDEVKDGTVLIAPGNYHLALKRTGAKYQVECRQGPLVHHVRPSVDVLFQSVARAAGPNAVGVVLTGMGKDGAEGLLAMRKAGAATLAQDEASCVVYGMPKEAMARGAVQEEVPLSGMAGALQLKIKKMNITVEAVER